MALKSTTRQDGTDGAKSWRDSVSSQLKEHAAQLASLASWKTGASTEIEELNTTLEDTVLRLRKAIPRGGRAGQGNGEENDDGDGNNDGGDDENDPLLLQDSTFKSELPKSFDESLFVILQFLTFMYAYAGALGRCASRGSPSSCFSLT